MIGGFGFHIPFILLFLAVAVALFFANRRGSAP